MRLKHFLRPRIILATLVIILGLGLVLSGLMGKPRGAAYETTPAAVGNITQEVNVTGKVQPAQALALAFERGGKIQAVNAAVGQKVERGAVLVTLDPAALAASLAQTEAQAAAEAARLEELRRGSRPEDLAVAATAVENAGRALADAQANLASVQLKTDTDLDHAYADAGDTLNDIYATADDALNKQIDNLFLNDNSNSPQLSFITTDTQAEIDAETQRVSAGAALKDFRADLAAATPDNRALEQILINTQARLTYLRDFMNRLNDALTAAAGLTQAALTAYKADLNTARGNLNDALASLTTQKQAIETQKVTNQTARVTAESQVTSAQNTLAAAEAQLALKQAGAAPEAMAAQAAAVRAAEAAARSLAVQLGQTRLMAPVGGIITRQEAKVGQIAAAGAALVGLMAETGLELEAAVAEVDVSKVALGQPARVTLDAYGPDVIFTATVSAIDPAETIIEGVATYKTKLQFAAADDRLRSGLTANIDIVTGEKQGVVKVPQRAVLRRDGEKYVRLLETVNGALQIREATVTTGLIGSAGEVEILSGLSGGENVVTFINQ